MRNVYNRRFSFNTGSSMSITITRPLSDFLSKDNKFSRFIAASKDTLILNAERKEKISLSKIFEIASQHFEQSSLDTQARTLVALHYSLQKRITNYKNSNCLVRFFLKYFYKFEDETAGMCTSYNKLYGQHAHAKQVALEEERRRVQTEKEERSFLALTDMIQSFDAEKMDFTLLQNCPPERFEAVILPLLQDERITQDQEKKLSLHLLFEKNAELYEQAKQPLKALSLRAHASDRLICAPQIAALSENRLQHFGATALKHQVMAVEHRLKGLSFQWQVHVHLRLNHHTREKFSSVWTDLRKNKELRTELSKKLGCEAIHFESNYKLIIPKIGEVEIGDSDRKVYCPYFSLHVTLEFAQRSRLYFLLSILGLGEAGHQARRMDIERFKLLHLFHNCYPDLAYKLERRPETFEKSFEALKVDLLGEYSSLQPLLPTMALTPIYKGHNIWSIPSLAQEAKARGAIGLMMGVGELDPPHDWRSPKQFKPFTQVVQEFASMMKWGVLSTQDRLIAGIHSMGASSGTDLVSGGGDSVFTRLWIRKWNGVYKVKEILFGGSLQVFFNLRALNTGPYCFEEDHHGAKIPYVVGATHCDTPYSYRETIGRFVSSLRYASWPGNEVCIKHRIPPEYICAVQVQTPENKRLLIEHLRQKELIQQGAILGIPIDEFILVGDRITIPERCCQIEEIA